MNQSRPVEGFETRVVGSNGYGRRPAPTWS